MSRLLFVVLLVFCSCYRVSDQIEPQINYTVQDRYLKSLPSPFPPLSASEREQDWGKEYTIGIGFARELELYLAITAFKRAYLLSPPSLTARRTEMEYEILLCYYLGKKYNEVTYAFEKGSLRYVDQKFPAFHDLLVILYDSYSQLKQEEQAQQILEVIKKNYPQTAETLVLSSALSRGDLKKLEEYPQEKSLLTSYEAEKKSIGKAQMLNATLPGAGYLYLGQRKSAFTAFFLNGLFIAAAAQCFQRGYIAAGAIFTSFEAGWYFGGIYGVGQEAKYYNERLFERQASPHMNQQKLFPVFQLKYAF